MLLLSPASSRAFLASLFLVNHPLSIAYTYWTCKYPARPDVTRRDGLQVGVVTHSFSSLHISRSGLNKISDPPFFWFLAVCLALNPFYQLCLWCSPFSLFFSLYHLVFFYGGSVSVSRTFWSQVLNFSTLQAFCSLLWAL
ncbi:hypothetical protein BJ912DRAFT_969668 [Pholiota molesta]|nr:hypothetical protein BJ912DRAFT_969668 [Pholiota molesta]